jgi:Protein of unknown function (DUF1566)/Repeat of unknown function (DUF5648)
MTHFSKKTIPAILLAALLSACGGQSTTDSATTSSVQKTAQTSQVAPILSPPSLSDLLASLALNYPDGKLPVNRVAQAAKDLAQNPAVLKTIDEPLPNSQSLSEPVISQASAADFKPVVRIQNTTLYGSYFFTIYDSERSAALNANPNWSLEGSAFWTSLAGGAGLSPVHRFRNRQNGSYLYTINDAERANIVSQYSATFVYEGVAWYAQQTPSLGWSPLYRFRNVTNGTYLFSAYESEKDAIVTNFPSIFVLEGIAYYVRQDAPSSVATCTPAAQGTTGYGLVFKLCNGAVAEYYDKTECIKDLATGLIWEGKPATGYRADNLTYTNYDSTTLPQYDVSTNPSYGLYYPANQNDIDAASNSVGFQNTVNVSNLCGSTAWRLPTDVELKSLLKTTQTPKIDSLWFPITGGASYWTSTNSMATATSPSYAMFVSFSTGFATSLARGRTQKVRLVRSAL